MIEIFFRLINSYLLPERQLSLSIPKVSPNYCQLGYDAKQIGRGYNVLKEHTDYLSRLIITSERLVFSTYTARRHIRQGRNS